MRPHLASLVDDFRVHAQETAVVAHRGVRRYRTTYGEVADLAGRFSAELARRGIAPGERVALWGANSAEWVGVFFGCVLRGVIVVPLDAAGSAEFAARVIADTKPKMVIGDAKLIAELGIGEKGLARFEGRGSRFEESATGEVSGAIPPKQSLDGVPNFVPRIGEGSDDPEILHLAAIGEHTPAEPLFAVDPAVTLDAPFQIVFTSGTTAEPRGIVHTHRNILVTLDPIEREIAKYRALERPFHPLRFLHSLPLSHVFGQFMGLWTPALLAAEVHFADQLDPSRIADLICRDRISVLIAVPRVLHLLRAHLLAHFPALAAKIESTPAAGLGTGTILKKWWRFRRVHRTLGWKFWAIISGGATLPPDLEAFYNKIGLALIQGYGMTETAALVTLNHPFHIAPGTIGKTLPGREVKIGADGEIMVRGAMLSGATWQHGAMHAREDEWLATGDLAEESEHGELKFLGRKGDVIVTGAGLNIHPGDLEAALAVQPGIRAAAVVPCDFAGGPEPVAVVISALDDPQLDAAVATANRTLAEFQQLRRVLRWPEPQFPYTSTGKLVRRKVAEWACEARLEGRGSRFEEGARRTDGAAPGVGEPGGKDALLSLIAELTGEPAPNVADTNALRLSEDLHLDSLGRVQLQSAIEQRFAIDIDDDAIATAETVGDLRKLMGGTPVERGIDSIPQIAGESDGRQNTEILDTRSSAVQNDGAIERVDSIPPTQSLGGVAARERSLTQDENVYPHWPWSWPIRLLRTAFIDLAMRPLVWLLAKPRVVYGPGGREAIEKLLGDAHPLEPRTSNVEPVLVISNHITAYDGALALYALPGPLRHHVAAAISGEMLRDYRAMRNQGAWILNLLAPAAYWLLTALFNVFPLPRDRGFRRSFAHAGEAMDRGYSVLIFPEGTRSLTGHMNRFRSGIGLLAQQTQVPVLPIALRGIYDLVAEREGSGPRTRWFHAGCIAIRVGAPIPAAELSALEPAALAARLDDALRRLVESN
jgi:long-chain acyl-CoA synthetase